MILKVIAFSLGVLLVFAVVLFTMDLDSVNNLQNHCIEKGYAFYDSEQCCNYTIDVVNHDTTLKKVCTLFTNTL